MVWPIQGLLYNRILVRFVATCLRKVNTEKWVIFFFFWLYISKISLRNYFSWMSNLIYLFFCRYQLWGIRNLWNWYKNCLWTIKGLILSFYCIAEFFCPRHAVPSFFPLFSTFEQNVTKQVFMKGATGIDFTGILSFSLIFASPFAVDIFYSVQFWVKFVVIFFPHFFLFFDGVKWNLLRTHGT